MRSRRRRFLVVAVLLGLSALAFALLPRGPRLELYTSPLVSYKGKTVRMQLLIPEGWQSLVVCPEEMFKQGYGRIDIATQVDVFPGWIGECDGRRNG